MNKTPQLLTLFLSTLIGCSVSLASDQDTSITASNTQYSPEDVAAIQTIVRDYLISHPQVIAEASIALRKQQQEEQQRLAQQAIKDNMQALFHEKASPILGNANGPLVLVEFFDYQCGYCKHMTPVINTLLKNNNNLKVVFKELPIFGGNSAVAAQAALAVYQINPKQYGAFNKALLAQKKRLTKDGIMAIAKKQGINLKQLQTAMKSKAVTQELQKTKQLSRAMGFSGTPALVIANTQTEQFEVIRGASSAEVLQDKLNQLQS